jgi:hypothetical protein
MCFYCLVEFMQQPLPLHRFYSGIFLQVHLGTKGKWDNLTSYRKKLFFSLANPFEIDFALASALSAKGAHLRLKILLQGLCLGFDEAASCCEGGYLLDDLDDFFFAL